MFCLCQEVDIIIFKGDDMAENKENNECFSKLFSSIENDRVAISNTDSDATKILTIGYEGREIGEFVDRLKRFSVSRLIDVRELPLSRKKGFSKSVLKERLKEEDIEYTHMKALGSPSSVRKKLKSDLDYDYFFGAYSKHLSNNMEAVKEVYQFISDNIICIMCYERFPNKCHRSAVANKIKEYDGNGLKIKHI